MQTAPDYGSYPVRNPMLSGELVKHTALVYVSRDMTKADNQTDRQIDRY